MIFTERTVRVNNDKSTINAPVILYRGDKNIEIRFELLESPYKYSNKGTVNIIETTDASYGQLVIKAPNDESPIFSDIVETQQNHIIFTITYDMIDEIKELGSYDFQIRLFDANQTSKVSLPEITGGIIIKEPIAFEDITNNVTNSATVGNAIITNDAYTPTFVGGKYNKTDWNNGDVISKQKLNKMEEGIYESYELGMHNSSQIKEKANRVDLETERKRIDNLTTLAEGSTTGDAELIDGRIDIDGKTHTNIGSAIRTQVKDLNNYLTYIEKSIDNGVFDIKNMYEWEAGYINTKGEYKNNDYIKRVTKPKFIPFTTIHVTMDGTNYNLHVIEYQSDGTFVKSTDYINNNSFSVEINENYKYAFCLQYRRDNTTAADLSTLSIISNLKINSAIQENTNKLECVNIKPRVQFTINASASNSLGDTVCKYIINEDKSYNLNMISGNGETYSLYNFSLDNIYSNISKNKYLIEIENLGDYAIDFSNIQNKFTLSNKPDFSGAVFNLKNLMDNQILRVGETKKILIDLNSDDIKNLFADDSNNLYFVFGYYSQLQNDRNFKLSFIDFTDYSRKGVIVADYLDDFDVNEYAQLKATVKTISDNLSTPVVEDKKIICCGDSLTMGAGWEDSSPDGVMRGYPEFIQEYTGITTINTGIGGDRCQEIFARLGSEPVVINNITIPSDKTPVELGYPLTTITGKEFISDLKYNASKSNKINPVVLSGIEGEITQPGGINTSYYFTRKEAGEEIVINRPQLITTIQMKKYRNKDYIYVFYVGQNGGYDDIDDWILQLKNAISYIGCDKYLIIFAKTNYHNDTWNSNYDRFKKEFRGNFLDIRSYLLNYGLEDNGLTPTDDDNTSISNGIIPPSLKKAGDNVHFNYYGYKTIGKIASQRLKELYPNYFN